MKKIISTICIVITSVSFADSTVIDARQTDVENCEYIGIFYGSSGWGNLAANMGIQNSKEEARENAAKAKATHILWTKENRGYTTSVEGQGYNCNKKKAQVMQQQVAINVNSKPTSQVNKNAETIAVLQLESNGVDSTTAKIISDLLAGNLQSIGRFRVLERNRMDQILAEQSFQNSGICSQSSCAVEMGKLLSLSKIMIGSIGRLGNSYIMTLRTIDVENGEVLRTSSRQILGGIEAFPKVIMEMATELSQ